MNIQESTNIKKELSQWINTLNDDRLLNLLDSIKNSADQESEDWWDDLTADQQKNIQLGLKDYNEGRILSSKSFWKSLGKNA